MALITSVDETMKYIANVRMLMVLYDHDCGKVNIDITIVKNTSRLIS